MEKMQKLNLRMQKLNFPGTHWRGLALIGAQKKPLNTPNTLSGFYAEVVRQRPKHVFVTFVTKLRIIGGSDVSPFSICILPMEKLS